MRRAVTVLLFSVASLGTTVPPATAGVVCSDVVAVTDFAYTPPAETRPIANDVVVCWQNGGDFDHTATSNAGVFDTGTIPPGMQGARSLYGSGTYGYHCSIHAQMTGVFRVRPTLSDHSIVLGDTVTLTVGSTDPLKGIWWDVQRKRGDGEWVLIKDHTFQATHLLTPSRTGTFRFRARTWVGENRNGWSPPTKLVVSEA